MADEKHIHTPERNFSGDSIEATGSENKCDTTLLSSVLETESELSPTCCVTLTAPGETSDQHGSDMFSVSPTTNSTMFQPETDISRLRASLPLWSSYENNLQDPSSRTDIGSTLNPDTTLENKPDGCDISKMNASFDTLKTNSDLEKNTKSSLLYCESDCAKTEPTETGATVSESPLSKISITNSLPNTNPQNVSKVFSPEQQSGTHIFTHTVNLQENIQEGKNANLFNTGSDNTRINDDGSRPNVIDCGNYSSESVAVKANSCDDSFSLYLYDGELASAPSSSGVSPSGFSSQTCKESDLNRTTMSSKSVKGSSSKLNKHPILSPCNCTRLMCISKIPEKWREILHYRFWSMGTTNLQCQWLVKHTVYKKRLTTKPMTRFQRCECYMPDESGNVVQVCQNFFLRTLGFRSHKIVSQMLEHKHLISKPAVLVQRGKKSDGKNVSENGRRIINMFIKSHLKKLKSRMKSLCGEKSTYDFACVQQAFRIFIALYPVLRIPYHAFREMFHTISKEASTVLHFTPILLISGLRKAYVDNSRLKKISGAGDRVHSLDMCKDSSLLSTSIGTGNLGGKEAIGGKAPCNGDNQVIMHLDIENDDIIITKNASDSSDTEGEGYPIENVKDKGNTQQHYQEKQNVHNNVKKSEAQMLSLKQKHPLLPPCACKWQCAKKLTEEKRHEIHSIFWSLDGFKSQKQWILRHVQGLCARRRTLSSRNLRLTMQYFLPDTTNTTVQVCPVYFHRTLGLKGDKKGAIRSRSRQNQADMNIESNTRRNIELFISNYSNKVDETLKEKLNISPDQSILKHQLPLEHVYTEFLENYSQQNVSLNVFRKVCQNIVNLPLEISPVGEISRTLEAPSGNQTLVNSDDEINVKEETSSGLSLAAPKTCKPVSHVRKKSSGSVRKASQSQLYEEEPIQRRRSSRKTRMQGSMAEDILLELGSESSMVSSIVSTHEKSQTSEGNMLLRPSSATDLSHLKRNVPGTSDLVDGTDQNGEAHVSASKTVREGKKRKFLGLTQPPKKRGRKKGTKNTAKDVAKKTPGQSKRSHKAGKFGRKGEQIKEDIASDKDDQKEVKKNSKKHYKLNSLKKKHKHPMLPSCNCSRRKCIQKISEERRSEIYETFWNFSSYKDRKRWLLKYVEKRPPQSRTLSLFPQRQNESKKYFLPSASGAAEEVCRLFFIHTLGFRWDSVIDMIVKTKKSSKIISKKEETVKKPPRQLPDYIINSVKQYLESVRNNAEPVDTKTKDIKDGMSENMANSKAKPTPQKVKELFADYKVQYKSLNFNLGYHSFRRILRSVVEPSFESDDPRETDAVGSCQADEVYDEDDVDEDVEHNTTKVVAVSNKKRKTKLKKDNAKGKSLAKTETSEIRKLKANNDTVESTAKDLDREKNITSDNNSLEVNFSDDPSKKVKSDLHAQLTSVNDGDECILDVGSGYFKRTPGTCASDNPHPPTNDSNKYKKRRPQSLRNDRKNYPVLPPCKCAKRRCSNKFTAAQREDINDMFWSLDGYNCRKQWILEHIKRGDIKRRVAEHHGNPRKLESRWYFLPYPDKKEKLIEVCKAFFLRTLGYRWDSVIDTIGKTTPKGTTIAAPDKRGRKPPPHKITEEAVNSMTLYIESVCKTYQPLYQQKSQPGKKGNKSGTSNLVPYGLTMKQLFEDYKSKHPNHRFGYESFRKIFRRVHGTILESQPPPPEPEPESREESFSGDQSYNEPSEEVVEGFHRQESSMVPTTDSYIEMGSYVSPPPQPPPIPQQHQEHPHLFGSVSERRSCLYQYGAPSIEHQQPTSHQSMHVTEPGTSGPDLYPHVEHDPYVKYSHNLYGTPPVASHPGHFPQMTEPVGFANNSNNSRTEAMDPSAGAGQSQFPPYFMSNPEPLRHQVYHMASQYQTILHHIAESSRFLNYPGFPASDGTYQGGQDKMYHYRNRPEFSREGVNPYNVPKSSQNCLSSESTIALNQYTPLTHMAQTSMQHEPTNMVISQYCEKKENGFEEDGVDSENSGMEQEQDLKVNFESVLSSDKHGKRKRSPKKGVPKKVKNDKPKVAREKKTRPKSLRNYGDHYPMLPACHCRKKNCNEKFSEEKRQKIHDMFWDLKGYNERKQWMLQNIKRENCKRRRIDQHESFRKLESRWYFFPTEDGTKVEVCKDFFLKTLGYKWDSVIDTIRRTTPKGETSVRPDQRGKKPPAHKLSAVVLRSVVQYIKSMQQASKPFSPATEEPDSDAKVVGHESNISNSISTNSNDDFRVPISIPYGLTMKDLFDDYKVKHATHKIGYESFRRIFRALTNPEKEIDGRLVYQEILNSEESSEIMSF